MNGRCGRPDPIPRNKEGPNSSAGEERLPWAIPEQAKQTLKSASHRGWAMEGKSMSLLPHAHPEISDLYPW